MYNKHDTDKILETCNSKLVDVIGDFHTVAERNGKYTSDCPKCGKAGGLSITPEKNIFHCFKCKAVTGHTATDYLMDMEGKTFVQALEYLQHKFSIVVDTPADKKIKPLSKKELKKTATYLDRMLIESGLKPEDIKAQVIKIEKNCTGTSSNIFYSGSVTRGKMQKGVGDDVLIEYYDLKGDPCKYETKINNSYTGKFEEFFRVRFQFPENNTDKQGKPRKYSSPYGSGNFLYIPEKIRELYRTGQKIDRLFLQEGEKKAEKACKHGIWSVGIAGIQNIAMDGKLPQDLITIIKEMEVKEVVLLFDADWNDISNNLKLTDQVEQRPRNFYYAARNFRDYMRSLKNMNISVEVLIGHIIKNEKHNKGIDDLLADTLKGNEIRLKEDIDTLINEKNLKGEYIQLFKISGMPDMKLEELWSINNPIAFSKRHQDTLKHLKEFKIGKHLWRFNEQGEVESAQPIESDEQFWETYTKVNKDSGQTKTMCEFIYENNLIFLQNRGFGRYKSADGTVKLVQFQHPVVKVIDHYYIRDYVKDFIRNLGYKYVLEMLHRGGPQYLGPDKMSDLNYILPSFEKPELDKQRFYFRNYVWETTERGTKQIEYSQIDYNIWDEEKHDDFDAKLIETPLINVFKDSEGEFDCTITELGKKCQFLQFLVNVSNFTWRKEKEIAKELEDGIKPENMTITIEPAEIRENHIHLVSKLCAIGYMLISAKDRSISRAVVAMDGKQSEVGQSNGRTGKSLLGEMFKQITPAISINGKKEDLERDSFLWDELSEKTKIVFMDDVRTNFNLEFLFTNITGDWAVNYKGGRRTTFPFQKSPKIYITTNHALNGTGGSFLDRQYLIAFSDWYSDTHKPVDDFGCQLFSDSWGFDQWNLHWNLMAYCVQVYLKYGVIQAPQERIAVRQMRQQMGETFLAWADEYFSDVNKLNVELIKKSVWDEYMKSTSSNPKYDTITVFKKRMKAFCQWKGYTYNPHMYDKISGLPLRYDKDQNPIEDDKRGGVEYIQIGTTELSGVPSMEVTAGNEVVPEGDDKPF